MQSMNFTLTMLLLSTVPSAVVSLEIKRNVDHSVTVYWQEPKRKEGNDLRYFVTINNDAGRFTRIQKYTINQKKERMKYIVSVSSIAAYWNTLKTRALLWHRGVNYFVKYQHNFMNERC